MTAELAAWLLQILDKDQAEAGREKYNADAPWWMDAPFTAEFVLADIEAKRAIIANCVTWIRGEPANAWYDGGRPQDLADETMRLLASAYADRPGYLDEWKPRD